MFHRDLLAKIKKAGILPVFCPADRREYEIFRDAVAKTPLPALEITLRNDFACRAIGEIKKDLPHIVVGAGTVLSFEALQKAVSAKADFLVAPGYSPRLLAEAEKQGIPFLPGVSTPSEIQNGLLDGLTTLKYFPAEASGGVKALTLYKGAFHDASFIPTGGITADNLKSYLALSNVVACGGSFMIPKDKLAAGDVIGIYDTIMNCLRG